MKRNTRKSPRSKELDNVAAFAEAVKNRNEMALQISEAEQKHVFNTMLAQEEKAGIIRQRQAKPGTLNLPELLDKRRIEHAIPDEFFFEQASFDRVFLYQVRLQNTDTFGPKSSIILSNVSKDIELQSSPYGIIVSAGMHAMDQLESNGISLGHIVGFIRECPWRKPVAYVDGVWFHSLLLRVGDITGSVDVAESLKHGDCKINVREIENDDGIVTREHVFVDKDGKLWNPSMPFIPADQ